MKAADYSLLQKMSNIQNAEISNEQLESVPFENSIDALPVRKMLIIKLYKSETVEYQTNNNVSSYYRFFCAILKIWKAKSSSQ